MNKQASSRQGLFIWLWPLALVAFGVALLLHNYLLLDFDVAQLWPVVLIAFGLQVLVRNDLGISWAGQTFGITRGSVQAGTLHAASGELDMSVRALSQPGRLIAGQYTARSRPRLTTENDRAILNMQRGQTWLLSLADWELDLAHDLPWHLLLSSFLGEIRADLRGLIIERAHIATGLSDIHVVASDYPGGSLSLHSTLGDIHVTLPDGIEACVTVQGSPLFNVHLQSDRLVRDGNRLVTAGYTSANEPLEITVRGTFGDLFLA